MFVPVSFHSHTWQLPSCCPGVNFRAQQIWPWPFILALPPVLWLLLPQRSLSKPNMPTHASERLHMLVPMPERLFPPGRFLLTLQGSVKSHLLQEAFPDDPSPSSSFCQIYVLGCHWLIVGLSPSLGFEGRASVIPALPSYSFLSTQYQT